MTEKRFTRDEHTGYLYDNGEIVEDVMKLLYALNDEIEQLKKTNDLLSDFRGYIDIKQQEKELPTDKNGYNKIICPICASDLKYSRFIGYMNGEQYEEFDCTQCDFSGRIRKGNLYDDLYE